MNEMINPNVLELHPYTPGKPVEEIRRKYNLEKVVKLASNENPFPIPAHVSEAIAAELANANRYPCSDCFFLRDRVAEYNGVGADNVVVGAGSVELIRMIVKTYIDPRKDEKILTSEKSFVFYKIAALEHGGKAAFVEVPMGEDYRYDLDAMYRLVDGKTKVIFIANPNNPTGTMLGKSEIMEFVDKVPRDVIIVFDNAYQEYVTGSGNGEDAAQYVDGIEMAVNRENIIVLRTFSKIYAMAGLRVGYAVSNETVISYLGRVKAPFNVTRPAQAAAMAALQSDEFKDRSARLNVKNREILFNRMTEMGLKVVPSKANFLLFFPGAGVSIPDLNDRLMAEGVIIRPMAGFGVPDAMRVTVGTEEENTFFIETLKKVLARIAK